MHRFRTLALLSLLVAGRSLSPAPATASDFTQLWALPGWNYVLEIGNTDGEIAWNGKDQPGRAAPSGLLFYEVTADGARQTGRMVRLGR